MNFDRRRMNVPIFAKIMYLFRDEGIGDFDLIARDCGSPDIGNRIAISPEASQLTQERL